MAIMITLPASTKWEDYEQELSRARAGEILNFKVPFLPVQAKVGDRCYLVWRDHIRGWMPITGLVANKKFVCSTTGREWDGSFIQRSGKFNHIGPIPRKGFRGFRYCENFPD